MSASLILIPPPCQQECSVKLMNNYKLVVSLAKMMKRSNGIGSRPVNVIDVFRNTTEFQCAESYRSDRPTRTRNAGSLCRMGFEKQQGVLTFLLFFFLCLQFSFYTGVAVPGLFVATGAKLSFQLNTSSCCPFFFLIPKC